MWAFLKSLLNLLQYCFCFFLCFGFFDPQACRILVSWPGIEFTPCIGGEVLTTGQPGKSQDKIINIHIFPTNVLWGMWTDENESRSTVSDSTLCNPMDCGLPWFSVHGISQERNPTGVGCHFPLQGILPTKGLIRGPNSHFSAFWNPCLILLLGLRSTSRNRALLKGCEISAHFLFCEIFCF